LVGSGYALSGTRKLDPDQAVLTGLTDAFPP